MNTQDDTYAVLKREYNFDPLKPPQPQYYDQWNAERKLRTQDVINSNKTITGKMIREQLLSLSMIMNAGYQKDTSRDILTRK